PYRANIDALKRLGCTDVIAVSAVGSLREDYAPGDFVLVDQYIDRTFAREKSFFGPGCVAHVSIAHPTCPRLGAACLQAATAAGIKVHNGATYLAMEGPQFSTLSESRLYRSWGADVIGMTGMPEAKLAREAELCYASLSMVTDYDCWHEGHGAVDVSVVLQTLTANATAARSLITHLPAQLTPTRDLCPHGCDTALTHALITAPDKRDPQVMARLDAVAGRVL
ncbi:MAG: S-methyl-5'-thioadenosine phosphorylase, partial [Paracoccaceae bacterium]